MAVAAPIPWLPPVTTATRRSGVGSWAFTTMTPPCSGSHSYKTGAHPASIMEP